MHRRSVLSGRAARSRADPARGRLRCRGEDALGCEDRRGGYDDEGSAAAITERVHGEELRQRSGLFDVYARPRATELPGSEQSGPPSGEGPLGRRPQPSFTAIPIGEHGLQPSAAQRRPRHLGAGTAEPRAVPAVRKVHALSRATELPRPHALRRRPEPDLEREWRRSPLAAVPERAAGLPVIVAWKMSGRGGEY